MFSVEIKGLKNLDRTLKTESRRQKKALDTAVKVEGFRLMKLLKKEVRKSAPGGKKLEPLTFISRRSRHRGRNSPLRRLSVSVRYFVVKRDPLQLEFGWTGPRVSKRWKNLSKIQQEGFTSTMTDATRKGLIAKGSKLSKRSKFRKYHFIKKTTKQFTTPARPIMEPFWRAYRDNALRNIKKNFYLKMQGKRI